MPQKNYVYAYQNIRNELEGIRNTLRYMQKNQALEQDLISLRDFKLEEAINRSTISELSNLHDLFNDILKKLPKDDDSYSLLKLSIKRLDEPDLQNFIKEIEGGLEETTEESPRVVYQQEYNEEYGAIIMKPYQLIDGSLYPCYIDANGHVTLLGMDADGS